MQKLPKWQSLHQSNSLAWMVLFVGLLATFFVSYQVKLDVERGVQREFYFNCDEVKAKIEARLETHKQILLGGAALFDASKSVEREEWHDYAKRMQIDLHFNGIQGLGFAQLIPKPQLASHIAEIRAQGFPDYTVRPPGERDVYSAVVYLEPFKGRNLRAFGYDMYSEPVRRMAMEQARDENRPALSGKVTLVQETNQDIQTGTLMYIPVYRKQLPITTFAQRRAALFGWVYSPFRMGDLLQDILTGIGNPPLCLRLEAYDGPAASAGSLLYDSDAGEKNTQMTPILFQLDRFINFNGRVWTLHFHLLKGETAGIDYHRAWETLAVGGAVSLLLFFLLLSYINTQRNAYRIADEMTTELHKANQRVQLQSSALNASANAIVITNRDAKIEWANPAFSLTTGYSIGEAYGHNPNELVKSGKQDQAYYKAMWDTILAKKVWRGELVNRRKDGTFYDEEMTITPLLDEHNEITHFVAVKQNISHRKKAEEAVQSAYLYARSLIEASLDPLVTISPQGKITDVNIATEQITGVQREHLIGSDFADYFTNPKQAREGYQRVFSEGTVIDYPLAIRHVSGLIFDVLYNASVYRDNYGKVIGVFAAARDITQRKKAESELQEYRHHLENLVAERTSALVKAAEAAEAANIAKSTFISTISHELRTPLNAILGFSEIMSREQSVTASQKQQLEIINRSGAHLLSMINDVLDISKIEAGRFELEIAAFDLPKLLQDVGNMIGVQAANKKLNFRMEIAPNIPQCIKADSGKLRQILINLLGNAIKFTWQGSVVLRANARPLAIANMTTLSFEIADSGIGISADQQRQLFKPFVQLTQEHSDVKGTGLGLAISKSLIELMCGQISISSIAGVGSTFKIELPVPITTSTDLAGTEKEQQVKGLAAEQPLWRLLIVDDNSDNRLLLVSLLTTVGFRVREAENGKEAIKVFQEWQPHLIWMDMRMPVMDGYEATRKIRLLPEGKLVKIIALTASAFKQQHEGIINAGCDAVLYKPVQIGEVFAALSKYLGVKYVYQDKPVATPAVAVEITAQMLAQLPEALRQQLHEAALNLDIEETDLIIGQIRELAPDIAEGLHNWSQHYQFDRIIHLTER